MNYAFSILVLPLVLATCTVLPVDPAAAERDFVAFYEEIEETYRREDATRLVQLYSRTDDFELVMLNGEKAPPMTDEQLVAFFQKQRFDKISRIEHLSYVVESFCLSGNEATAVVSQDFSRHMPDAAGVDHLWRTQALHRERWIRRPDGRWQLRSLEEIGAIKETRDGRPVG